MLKDIYICILLLSVLPFVTCAGIACYNCNSTSDPLTCKHTVHCPEGQQCLITKTSTADGFPSYKMGCATTKVCNSLTGAHVIIGRRQSGGECKACCNTAHCNRHCCNNKATLEACCKHYHGYTYVSETNICIKLHKTPLSWTAAEETCTGENGHLLVVRNLTEQHAVRHHIGTALSNIGPVGACHSHNQIWVGGNDMEKEGTFQWSTGKHFTHWQTQQLKTDDGSCDHYQNGADCVLISLHGSHWFDRHCEYQLPFVCQIH